jgi:GNAT superfamily N-acetyltransferase
MRLIVECPDGEVERVKLLLTQEMEGVADLSVPLNADSARRAELGGGKGVEMELRPIADLDSERPELTEAFPPNERKPLAEIRALLEAGRYEALGLYDGAALLGYANLWREPAAPGYVLLDYLGVTASRRNGGLGSLILRKLAGQCAGRCGVLTEAEWPDPDSGAPEEVLRRRRVAFCPKRVCPRL